MFDAVVINDASLPFGSLEECESNIDKFFELLHESKLHNVQFTRVDDIEGNWNQLDYADGFMFGQWLNNITDIERQRQVKSVLSNVKCPLVNMRDNREGVNTDEIIFVLDSIDDVEVLGLGFASLNNSHGISFSSDSCWMTNSISIIKLWEVEGVEQTESLDVPNIATIEQLRPFLENFEAQRQQNKAYLDDLKTEDNADFENIQFTESVLKTLKSPSLLPLDFRKVTTVLRKLNSAIVISSSLLELSENAGLSISGESESTMSNTFLKRIRTFKHPTLGSQVFEVHVKNFSGAKRMHILADYDLNKVCIGYFGKHLKTA
jgi:hypothetical protein